MICKEKGGFISNRNNGKVFEANFKESIPSHIWSYRPPDTGGGMMIRFAQESLCDLITYDTKSKKLSLLELKSTVGTSFNFAPYEECMQYEKDVDDFDKYFDSLNTKQRSDLKDKNKEIRKNLREQYRKTNRGMIKYHQIRTLIENQKEYGINGYLVFTFIRNSTTYLVPIKSFYSFWKETTKKSINEKDIKKMVEEENAWLIPQKNRGRSKINFDYDLSILEKI